MAFTCDSKRAKLLTWRANHDEFGDNIDNLEIQWWIQGRSLLAKNFWDPAKRDAEYVVIATAQPFTIAGTYYADRENSFWAQYTPTALA